MLLFLGCSPVVELRAQSPCTLHVTDGVVDVPGATVWLNGRPVGSTNARGEWMWPSGVGRLRIEALGYKVLEVDWGDRVRITLRLFMLMVDVDD